MKNTTKFLCFILILSLPVFAFSQSNYQSALKKLNDYFKTFDAGYYGYFEVKDGYLYDQFASGKYTKTPMNQLGDITVAEANRKVTISCVSGDCTYSTYTNSYHSLLQFSQSKDFNTGELITLFKNFINAYNSTTTASNTNLNTGYQSPLKKLNDYLKTFDNGYYGYFEVKEGYLYGRFPSGKYTKTPLAKLGSATVAETKRKVTIPCKDNEECVFSTYTDSYHSMLSFSQSTDFNTTELINLLDNFVNAYNGNSSSTSQSGANSARLEREKESPKPITETEPVKVDRSKYLKSLNALNLYLKTFNPETYGEVEIILDKVYFNFKVSGPYYSYIPISDLLQKTTVLTMPDEIKISCNGSSKCFYSSYAKSNTDHFRFFSLTVKDLTKMRQLVDDFINALR